ncbi:MAG: methanogenesis marker protein Mmp4/MtxX [Candidatus Helarchaeota archaeon]
MEKIKSIGLDAKSTIAFGVSINENYLDRIKSAVDYYIKYEFINIVLVCRDILEIEPEMFNKKVKIIKTNNPSTKALDLLIEKKVDGIVRGTISSSKFLKTVKEKLNIKKISRIAILEDISGREFFFAPVGIDEGRTSKEKIFFIDQGSKILKDIGIEPSIAVLSGGRMTDISRAKFIRKSIKSAIKAVKTLKKMGYTNIFHSEILIEEAIKESNFIMAPDGISGNLIYRTLVHLGGGFSHGAIYIEPYLKGFVIIDTSRVGPINEYIGSIMLATTFSKLIKKIDLEK